MGTAYLHIGMPKTGTSALQRFLAVNRERLKENGFLFPDFGYDYPDVRRARNGYFLSRITHKDFWEQYKAAWEGSFWQLGEYAKRYENIILSDESIWSVQRREGFWEAVRELFVSVGLDLHIIVYLRRQDAVVESYWNQKVKGHSRLSITFDEFMEREFHHIPLRYKRMLGNMEDIVKPKRLTVRAFERGQLSGGNIIDDFCQATGIAPDENWQYPAEDVNVSFDLDAVDVKRLINENASYRTVEDFYYKAIAEGYGEYRPENEKRYSAFSGEERKEFLERFEKGNEYVARRYLKRKDGKLFYEPLTESEKWEPDALAQYRAAVRVLSGADILLYQRLDGLEERVAELERKDVVGRLWRKWAKKRK